jgi:hypothetical protein
MFVFGEKTPVEIPVSALAPCNGCYGYGSHPPVAFGLGFDNRSHLLKRKELDVIIGQRSDYFADHLPRPGFYEIVFCSFYKIKVWQKNQPP